MQTCTGASLYLFWGSGCSVLSQLKYPLIGHIIPRRVTHWPCRSLCLLDTSGATEQHQALKFCLLCARWHLQSTNLSVISFLPPIWPCNMQQALGRAFLLFARILSPAENALRRQGKWRTSTTGSSNTQSSSLDQEMVIWAENRRIRETFISVGDCERKEPIPFQKTSLPGWWLKERRWSSRSQTRVTRNCWVFGHKIKRVKIQLCAEDSTVLWLQIKWAGWWEGMRSSFAQQFKCIAFLTPKKLQEWICLKRFLNIMLILIIQFSASEEHYHLYHQIFSLSYWKYSPVFLNKIFYLRSKHDICYWVHWNQDFKQCLYRINTKLIYSSKYSLRHDNSSLYFLQWNDFHYSR